MLTYRSHNCTVAVGLSPTATGRTCEREEEVPRLSGAGDPSHLLERHSDLEFFRASGMLLGLPDFFCIL